MSGFTLYWKVSDDKRDYTEENILEWILNWNDEHFPYIHIWSWRSSTDGSYERRKYIWNITEFSMNVENTSKVAQGGIEWEKAKDKETKSSDLGEFFVWGVRANLVSVSSKLFKETHKTYIDLRTLF